MKNLKFWSVAIVLTFLSIGTALAEVVKFDFSTTDQMTTKTTSSSVWTVGNATMTINSNCSGYLSAPLRVYNPDALAFAANNDYYFESIVAYVNTKDKPVTGLTNSTWTGANLSADGNVVTFTPSSDNVNTIATSSVSAQFRLDSVVCTIKLACTAPAKELTMSPTNSSLEVGQGVKLTADGGNGGTIVYTSSDNNVATVSADGTIQAIAKGSATITATQAANGDYCSQKAEVSVSVLGECYTITWQGPAGSTTSKIEQGAALGTLGAAVASCDETNYPEFIGWSATNIGKTPVNEVTLVNAETVPTGNTTYYAVFANKKPIVDGYTLITDTANLTVGDVFVIGYYSNNSGKVAGELSGKYLIANDATFENEGNKLIAENATIFRLGGTKGAWTFTDTITNKALGTSAQGTMTFGSGTTTWNITKISYGRATILSTTSSYGYLKYNTSSPRFTTYGSTACTEVRLYKYSKGNTDEIEYISQCCDAWTVAPTFSCDKYNVDADALDTAQITTTFPEFTEYTASHTPTFVSSNEAVATVSSLGVVTPIGAGTCVVTMTWSGDPTYCDYVLVSDTFRVKGHFSVAYNKNAEGVTGEMASKQYVNDAKIGLDSCKFARTGYHFVGWALSADGQKMYNDGDSLTIISTMNLFAVWEINNYAVTKGAETNGTFVLSAENVDHGGNIVVTKTPDEFYKNGTVVITPAENGEVVGDTIKNITGAIEVTVNFEEKTKYAITWHSCNGEVETTHVHEGFNLAKEEGLATPKGSCSSEHTYFYGWSTARYGHLNVPEATAPGIINENLIPEGDLDLYAVYANGVVGGAATMTKLAIGDQVVIVSGDSVEMTNLTSNVTSEGTKYFGVASAYTETPSKTYILDVVAGSSEGTFAFKTNDNQYLFMPSSDKMLYKQETLDANTSWTVSFTGTTAKLICPSVAATRYIQYNSQAGRFAAYTSAQGSISLYNAKPAATEFISSCCEYLPFDVKNDTLYFAKDTTIDLSAKVIGEGNKGEFHYAIAEDYDTVVVLTGANAQFKGYGTYRFIISQDGKFDGAQDTCEVIKELTIRTVNPYCTIKYDKNDDDATGEMADMVVKTYTDVKLSACTFSKTGYHFAYWNTKADGTGDIIPDTAKLVAEEMTLYARWEINKYAISINSSIEHGSIALSSNEVEHDGSIVVTPNPDFGYKLSAVTAEPAANCTIDGETISNIVGAITVSAEFVAVPVYTVTYRDAATDSITSEQVEEGKLLNPDLTKFGCERMPLVGFSATEVADSSKTYTAINLETYTVTGDITLWAVYTLNKGESGDFDPSRTKNGNFKIYAISDGQEVYAKSTLSSYHLTSTTNIDEAAYFTFVQVNAGEYYIKNAAGKYLIADGSNLKFNTTKTSWLIEAATIGKGSWRVYQAGAAKDLAYREENYQDFRIVTVSTCAARHLEIGYNDANIYSSNPICDFVDVTGISLDKTSEIIRDCENNGQLQITATVMPADATVKDVIWTSSNTSVATVDENGLVTFVSNGSATITATTKDEGKTATCKIIARYCVNDVELNKTSLEFKTCESTTGTSLNATVSPSAAYDKSVTWSSDNTEVATVSASGYVKVVGVGEAIITVTTTDGNYTASCFVTVRECVLAEEIILNADSLHFLTCEDRTEQLTATILPDSADITTVSWSSSNNKVVKVSSTGLVTPVAAGSAKITASATDGSGIKAQCVVVVENCETAVDFVTISNNIFARSGMIVIENANAQDVRIYNAVGQLVANKERVTDLQVKLPAGAYVVRLGDTMTKVIVK